MDLLFADIPRMDMKAINSALAGYLDAERYRVLLSSLPPEIARLYGRDLYEETCRYAEKAGALAAVTPHDVIHAHDWLAIPAGMAAKAATGKPLVVHVHATEFDRTADGAVNQLVYDTERAGMHAADAVVAVSGYTKSIIAERYDVDPGKVSVVHNGIDPREKTSAPRSALNEHYKIVLFLGRLTVQKGPDHFLNAAKRVAERDPDARFVIAGSGDMERRLVMQAAELGIGDKVIFAGFRRGAELDRLYRMADVYVMPSVSEPFGITALEAVQQGAPVIVSAQSGVREVLDGAIQADFWDIELIADRILALLASPEEASRVWKRQRAALDACTWDQAAKKLQAMYEALAPSGAAAHPMPSLAATVR